MKAIDQMTDDELRRRVISRDYPLVQCSHSGVSLPGYLVCVHAIADSAEVVVNQAIPTKVGKIICPACARSIRIGDLRTTCAHFVRDHFAIPL